MTAWHFAQDRAHLFVTSITLAEVWQGFRALKSNHPDYDRVKSFVGDLSRSYRILKFDGRAAAVWGEINTRADGPLPLRDSLIAAIARSRGSEPLTPWKIAEFGLVSSL